MWRKFTPFIILAIVSVLYLTPLIKPGFYRSHDGENHLIRFGAYIKAFSDGQLPPRWAGDLNYRYGTPVLNFFYPLPGYLATVLSKLGLSLQDTFKLIVGIAFVAAPLTFFLWARLVFPLLPALASSLLWGLAPYHFLNLYVRGDIGELLSFVFAPLVLWSVERLAAGAKHKVWALGAIFWSLLILSHHGLALILSGVLLGYGVFLAFRKPKILPKLILMLGLSLGLSAFFWAPAIIEQRYLHYGTLVQGLYQQHFPTLSQVFISPWGFGDKVNLPGGLSPQLGGVPTLIVFLAAIRILRKKTDRRLHFFLLAFFVGLILTLPLSSPIWKHLLILQKLQFPWRLTAATSFAASVIAGFVLVGLPTRWIITLISLFLITTIPLAKVSQRINYPDSYYLSHPAATYYHGEAMTIWSPGNPGQYPKEPASVIAGSAKILNYQRQTEQHRFVIEAAIPSRILDNTFYYPGWRVYVDGVKVPIEFQDQNHRGLITFSIPQGLSAVTVSFGETPLRTVGNLISIFALGTIIILLTTKTFRLNSIILWAIVVMGGFLRFYQLGSAPMGLHRDEAFLGYNAYSLLKTGREITGAFLPLHLPSFLWSPAGYAYLSIPWIALFGLSAFSVRFASALLGTLTVLLAYFLTIELFHNQASNSTKITFHLSLITSLLLAISPWHLNLSRTATENTVVVFFITLGTLWFHKATRSQKLWLLVFAFASFGATYLLYQAPRAFLPLFVPLVLAVGWRKLTSKMRMSSIVLYLMIILLPPVFILRSGELSTRIRTVSLFATQETTLNLEEFIREDGVAAVRPLAARLFHNKLTAYTTAALSNYFAHTTFGFLATDRGLPDRYRVPGMGLMYLPELAFFLLGIYFLPRQFKEPHKLLLGWLILAPLGSALTFDDVPNLQRTLLAFPAVSITVALGLIATFNAIKKAFWRTAVFGLVGLILFGSLIYYLHQYYLHQPRHRPWYRHEGYSQLVEKVNALLPRYRQAVITNHESSPTIFSLFYNRFDPAAFQEIIKKNKPADLNTAGFAGYEFSQEACPLRLDPKTQQLTGEPGILYVNFSECRIDHALVKELGVVKRGDDSEVFRLLTLELK